MARHKRTYRPPHYRLLSLQNFRGFKKACDIPLRPLTFLVGPNSAGKSSLFDALLLIAQSRGLALPWQGPPRLAWVGELVDLGSYGDAVHGHDIQARISIDVQFYQGDLSAFSRPGRAKAGAIALVGLMLKLRGSKTEPAGLVSSCVLSDVPTGNHIRMQWSRAREPKLVVTTEGKRVTLPRADVNPRWALTRWIHSRIDKHPRRSARGAKTGWRRLASFVASMDFDIFTGTSERVSSGRAAPRRSYPTPGAGTERRFRRFEPTLFSQVDPAMLETLRSAPRHRRRAGTRAGVLALARVLERLDIADTISHAQLSEYHSAIRLKDNRTAVESHLIDVGYGASQVIPVIAGCLSDMPGPLFVEQPEIHLHPKAQGVIAELLCNTSKRRQVIVETHAVHMVNRARLMIAQGKLNAHDVTVNFVSRDETGSHVQNIPILPDGEFAAEWPGGFFDERYQETMKLLQFKGKGHG